MSDCTHNCSTCGESCSERTAESLPALFDARCRALAGETAPAKGLWLMEVRY